MKSLANDLSQVVNGLFKDIAISYPTYGGVCRDIDRLTRMLEHRGLGVFTFDLPALDNLLLEGLENGRLALRGPLSQRKSKRILVPRFLSGLWLRVFDTDGRLKTEVDTTAIFFLRQIFCLGKRISKMCSPDRIKLAIKEYIHVENQLTPPTLKWDEDDLGSVRDIGTVHLCDSVADALPLFGGVEGSPNVTKQLLARCQRVADIIAGNFSQFEAVSFSGENFERGERPGFKHGPGAVADRRGIVNKFDFPRWSAKLERCFPYRECGTLPSDVESSPVNHEVPSRLIAVAKTAKTPRLIAAEPTEHQWCQQLILHFMKRELRKLFGNRFITLSDQRPSGSMAQAASRDADLATVDLSSASDRLTCFVVERIFRKNPSLLKALHAARTRSLSIDIEGVEPLVMKLKKFASQGTAVTFPVQSIVFLCLALGCSIQGPITIRNILRYANRVRVFGDDIVIPKHGYDHLLTVLSQLDLKVNQDKSFVKGYFRESCGTDAYRGDDVTPVKPASIGDYGPESRIATLDCSNNFFMKGLWHTAEAVIRLLPRRIINSLRVKGSDVGAIGLVSFCGNDESHLRRRWCDKHHVWKVQHWGVKATVPRHQFGGRYALMQFLTELPPSDQKWTNGVASRPKVRDHLRWETSISL